MRENLKKFLRDLSIQDSKTLSQKGLKVAEEAGELAKVILPFENAPGTIHRFKDRKDVLEEVVDVYLTAISIAYSLDCTDEEIEDMISYKAKKWANLQKREAKVQGKIPYEIHVTILNADRNHFIQTCKDLGVKPIILALQNDQSIIEDVMTSSVHMGDNRSAYEEMKRISNGLVDAGITVVREKIETVPWHPAAPSTMGIRQMPEDCYFETHIGVIVPGDLYIEILKDIAKRHEAHMSRNAFKKHEDGSYTQMITYRRYKGTYEDFEREAQFLESQIKHTFEIEKRITEFSIYDTKVSHDSAWLLNEQANDIA